MIIFTISLIVLLLIKTVSSLNRVLRFLSFFEILHFYQMRQNLFFFGTWLTVIFFSNPDATPFRGRNIFTCSPTFIFFVSAPWGKTAWTWGTTVEFTTPPSGPIACTSCRIREMIAKYWGKSVVRIRVIRFVFRSSSWVVSKIANNLQIFHSCFVKISHLLHQSCLGEPPELLLL